MSVLSDNIFEPQVIVLGVFGNTNKISEKDLQENTLTLILQELGRIPDKILLPSEGNSSIYIQEWAESLHIKTQVFQSDWIRNGKVAQIIRDDRIFKECTHALVFLSQKSNRLELYAEKICKKGKRVFTSSHNQQLIQLEMLCCEPSLRVSERAHKLNKGKGQTLLKFQMKAEC
jgi:hypothetical protein